MKTFKNLEKYGKNHQQRQVIAATALSAQNDMNSTLTTKFSIGGNNQGNIGISDGLNQINLDQMTKSTHNQLRGVTNQSA